MATTRSTKMPGVTIDSGSSLPGSTTSATWTIVTLPAIAISGPKFRAVLLYRMLPWVSATRPLMSEKSAQMPCSSKNFLPPPQFDRPYEGELKIVRGTQADLRAACPSSFKLGNHAIGCMQLHLQGMPCIIYILNDIGLQAIGWDYDIVLRHERGHCNGWKHD